MGWQAQAGPAAEATRTQPPAGRRPGPAAAFLYHACAMQAASKDLRLGSTACIAPKSERLAVRSIADVKDRLVTVNSALPKASALDPQPVLFSGAWGTFRADSTAS